MTVWRHACICGQTITRKVKAMCILALERAKELRLQGPPRGARRLGRRCLNSSYARVSFPILEPFTDFYINVSTRREDDLKTNSPCVMCIYNLA